MNSLESPTPAGAVLVHQCLTKATTAEGEELRYSHNWVVSRRAMLEVWSDRLVCGDWTIPYDSITKAVLVTVPLLFRSCHVLQIDTAGKSYQFGLRATGFWAGALPFPVTREKGRLGYSAISIVARVIIVACLIYFIWRGFH